MLYSEFVQGTGCKETDHNFKIYQDLEILYMNSNLSKQEIYEYGKKLVDNSKTPAELEFEAEINGEIDDYRSQIKYYQNQIELHKDMGWSKDTIRYARAEIKKLRRRIRECKWILGQGEL